MSIVPDLSKQELWFITGSQHLYGPQTLAQVAEHSKTISAYLEEHLPFRVVFKPVLTTPDAITGMCREANNSASCTGIVAWMHTFSPAKMWIAGLNLLNKPLAHLHTQYNRDIPWAGIDMDFMNLNQSAHGDREFGHIVSRLRMNRAVIVGFWQDPAVLDDLEVWGRAAAAWHDAQGMRIARFGDNMREVAVTEGDKVEAQIRLGYSVNGYGVGDLADVIRAIEEPEIDALLGIYDDTYDLQADLGPRGARRAELRESARIECGMRTFLETGGFKAFTTTFEDLHGLRQLPGLAVQRLMAEGYGFGAEGDWKHAALVRAMKVMALGLPGGVSFMEDYTYHLDPGKELVLGAHMLEICPSIASGKPRLEMHPLGIGGKEDPARLVFGVAAGKGINASIVDMGDRFRLIANPCTIFEPEHAMPKLPVARVLWVPEPNLKTGAAAWIYAGGAHHTGFGTALKEEHMSAFADIAGIEYVLIDSRTEIPQFRRELKWNDVAYLMGRLRV